MTPLFTQVRVATNAGLFLEGLLGDAENKKSPWGVPVEAEFPQPLRCAGGLG